MRRAFTLVELLVVIAIIAILAGMLMPALARARQEAYKAACINNQKQVGLYLQMYRTDSRDSMPTYGFADSDGDGTPDDPGYDSSLTIALLFPDYADTEELFTCPATDHQVALVNTYENVAPWSGAIIDEDGDAATDEYRFDSDLSLSNDPDYLIDPAVPRNARSTRVVYGDGPDLASMRFADTGDWDDPNWPADQFANHIRGTVLLHHDGHVDYHRMANNGEAENTELVDHSLVPEALYDPDVYRDDDHDANADFGDDTRADCDLGNYADHDADDTTRAIFWAGPAWDQNP